MQPRPTFRVNGPDMRKFRMSKGIEISEAADAAGITASYLSRVEVGTASGHLRPGTYTALRDYMGAADDDLLAPTEEPAPPERK